eukprot:EG_transcript_11769
MPIDQRSHFGPCGQMDALGSVYLPLLPYVALLAFCLTVTSRDTVDAASPTTQQLYATPTVAVARRPGVVPLPRRVASDHVLNVQDRQPRPMYTTDMASLLPLAKDQLSASFWGLALAVGGLIAASTLWSFRGERGQGPSQCIALAVSATGENDTPSVSEWTAGRVTALFRHLCRDSVVDFAACEEAGQEVEGAAHWHLDPGRLAWQRLGPGEAAPRLLLTAGPLAAVRRAAGLGPAPAGGAPPLDDSPIGALALTYGPNPLGQRVAFVHLVAAWPRGQGVGSALLRQAEAVAQQRQCTHVVLRALDDRLEEFYLRQGYSPLDAGDGGGRTVAVLDRVLTDVLQKVGSLFGVSQWSTLAQEGTYMVKEVPY